MAGGIVSSVRPAKIPPRLTIIISCVATVVGICAVTLPFAQDYVGTDNDDAMRLVEVRDFLAGQGWFDMMQYRLGLEPGTLMHWSRLIDWPIAALIRLFGLWFSSPQAEALALTVWPLLWTVPVMLSLGLAALRLGGRRAMHAALVLTALYLLTSNRFLPGSIDHHNVQIALVAFLVMVLTVSRSWRAYAAGGVACALALAIGAETTPMIAMVCLIVAVKWAVEGEGMQGRVMGFSLSLALFVTLFFILTVPPSRYRAVTCDNLSFGYYALTAMGSGLLFGISAFASRSSRVIRFATLAFLGVSMAGSAMALAPQCLGNPLADLDPMLVTLWLNTVGEAKSFLAIAKDEPAVLGGFYAVGFLAMLVCLVRIGQKNRTSAHTVLALLLAVSWSISLIQVRGFMFANLLAILPLALVIADLKQKAKQYPHHKLWQASHVGVGLLSIPSVWAVMGVLIIHGSHALQLGVSTNPRQTRDCKSASDIAQLAQLPAATVAAPTESGTAILRFTHHRVLAAPYHRDQGGMLTELHIGLSTPGDAEAFLRGGQVGILAFCTADAQTQQLIRLKPDGLYADLAKGQVPDYLTALPDDPQSGFRLFLMR